MENKEINQETLSETENISSEERAQVQTDETREDDRKHHHSHHHGHHHKHHRHHHRHRSKRRKSKTSLKKFWSKNKKVLLPIALFLMIGLIMGSIVLAVEIITHSGYFANDHVDQGTEGSVVISVSVYDTPQTVVNDAAMTIAENQDMNVAAHVLLKKYNDGETRLDVSQPVQISFYVANKPKEYQVEKFVVELTEAGGDCRSYTLDAQQKKVELYNLKTNAKYEYKINVHFTNSVVSWVGGSFQTADGPRILTVGGIRNVRDIGGWETTDGKTVKQGLLYRGTELDGKNEEYKLTEEGKKMLLEILQVQTELDLRWPKEIPEGVDTLGETVQHLTCGMPLYTDVFLSSGKESIRTVFSYLADPDNYPIYMHCIYGRDRTGTVCALLMALLGISEEDINREYQLTALSNQSMDIAFGGFITQLKEYEGDTLQQKAETFLLSAGVTNEEIDSIRTIFLG